MGFMRDIMDKRRKAEEADQTAGKQLP